MLRGRDVPSLSQDDWCMPEDPRGWFSVFYMFLSILGFQFGEVYDSITVKNLPAMWETWVLKIPWRREKLPTPVFWPGEFHGLYSLWGHRESDTTE